MGKERTNMGIRRERGKFHDILKLKKETYKSL
jgi:hypothetical protein